VRPLAEPFAYFFLDRSGTTVVTVGITAPGDRGLEGEESFFGFLDSLLVRCWPLGIFISRGLGSAAQPWA
jgi:hypothetical protein